MLKKIRKRKTEGLLILLKDVNNKRRDFWLINIKVTVLWNKFHIH